MVPGLGPPLLGCLPLLRDRRARDGPPRLKAARCLSRRRVLTEPWRTGSQPVGPRDPRRRRRPSAVAVIPGPVRLPPGFRRVRRLAVFSARAIPASPAVVAALGGGPVTGGNLRGSSPWSSCAVCTMPPSLEGVRAPQCPSHARVPRRSPRSSRRAGERGGPRLSWVATPGAGRRGRRAWSECHPCACAGPAVFIARAGSVSLALGEWSGRSAGFPGWAFRSCGGRCLTGWPGFTVAVVRWGRLPGSLRRWRG